MRKILLLIPFLFISVKPYQQVITANDTVKSLDTIQLVKTVDTISMEIEKSKRLDVKKNKAILMVLDYVFSLKIKSLIID